MKKIAIKLKPAAERFVKKGHPWVFEDSIVKQKKDAKTGDLAIIFDSKKNKFIASGFYDEDSVIRIKCFQFHTQVDVNEEFFHEKIKDAFSKRRELLSKENNSYRLIYGENDFLPSMVVDVYNNCAVIKIYSLIWVENLEIITKAIKKIIGVETIVLRLSRNIEAKAKDYNLFNGKVLIGKLEDSKIQFKENGLNFIADVVNGHKTGYFLDQRDNRKKVGKLSKDKSVLDVFSYNGGFTVNALCNRAKSVTSIDISKQAIESIQENLNLNKYEGKFNFICDDAFTALNNLINEGKSFDIVVIDPPSFAKKESEIKKAKEQYSRLAKLGSQLVNKNGILVLASCSSRVSEVEFIECNESAFKKASVNYELIEKTAHTIDHKAIIPEMNYLKCMYYRVL